MLNGNSKAEWLCCVGLFRLNKGVSFLPWAMCESAEISSFVELMGNLISSSWHYVSTGSEPASQLL